MCIQDKLCCAPTAEGQCRNKTVAAGSDHCSKHHDAAVESCIYYKRICKIADSKNVYAVIKDPREHLKHLYDCHKVLTEAYSARLEHAEKYYVIQRQDYGHDKQFEIIMTKINFCRLKSKEIKAKLELENERKSLVPALRCGKVTPSKIGTLETLLNQGQKLRKYLRGEPSDDENEEESPSSEICEVEAEEYSCEIAQDSLSLENAMIEEITQFEKKQKERDLVFNRQLKADRKKNKKLADEKKRVASLLKNIISKELTPEFDIYFLQLSFIYIIQQLYSIDYFEDYYEPEQCNKCRCNNYIPQQFRLGCGCFLSKDGECVDFLVKNSITTGKLSHICELILTKQLKFRPILKDLLHIYKINGTKILFHPVTLTWDPSLNRLVLTSENVKNYHKISVTMSQDRKRRSLDKPKLHRRKRDISPSEKWGYILDQLSEYVEQNGKLPPENSKNPSTSFLYTWVSKQLDDYENQEGLLSDKDNRTHFMKFIKKYKQFFSEDSL